MDMFELSNHLQQIQLYNNIFGSHIHHDSYNHLDKWEFHKHHLHNLDHNNKHHLNNIHGLSIFLDTPKVNNQIQ